MLKKTTAVILALLATNLASAGEMSSAPACVPGDVTVPCEATKWDLGVQALYLRPIYGSERGYGVHFNDSYNLKNIAPDWDWGYRLEGSYHYKTGSDATINLTHFDASSHAGTFTGQYTLITQLGPLVQTADFDLELNNRMDQVNLVFGQHIDLGLQENLRLYGGVQYLNLRVNSTSNFDLPLAIELATNGAGVINNTNFSGAGPVMGVDYGYNLTQGLSLTANTAASLLYGTSRLNAANAYGNGLVLFDLYNSRKVIVPGLEAKLGANYALAMMQGMLNIQGGYQVTNYFNVLQDSQYSVLTTSDFGLYGPYLGVKWLGNA